MGGRVRAAVRRIVTGHDAAGKARIVFDSAAPNVKLRPAQGGVVSTLVGVTDESPADLSDSRDRAARAWYAASGNIREK